MKEEMSVTGRQELWTHWDWHPLNSALPLVLLLLEVLEVGAAGGGGSSDKSSSEMV